MRAPDLRSDRRERLTCAACGRSFDPARCRSQAWTCPSCNPRTQAHAESSNPTDRRTDAA